MKQFWETTFAVYFVIFCVSFMAFYELAPNGSSPGATALLRSAVWPYSIVKWNLDN